MLRSLLFVLLCSFTAAAQTPFLGQAGRGITTLQGWYDESTGLYRTTGWWNSANSITVLADYAPLAKSPAYDGVFANTFTAAQNKSKGFLNNFYDDEGWWALAWVDAYDHTRKPEYLAMARSIFADMSASWDGTCGGGIWWSKDRKYKNAIANELFLSVAAHLAARSAGAERKQYTKWAGREWKWFRHSGMINGQGLVNDGLDLATCKNNGRTTWTYNQGVVLGGVAELQTIKRDKKQLRVAKGIADAALAHLTDANGVLHDTCEPNCGGDGVQFKGIFLRNLAAFDPVESDARYAAFAETNAKSILDHDQGPDFHFGEVWSGPYKQATAATQTSALDAILAASAMRPAASRTAAP